MAAVRPTRKTVECGLEVPRGVVYRGWEPGGQYTKTLVVKNVQLRTQRIKYTIKGDRFHSAVYPRPITLSAGMSYTLAIVFKPNKKEPCEESIQLETSEGAVEVLLRAVLPSATVALPESLTFGLSAVQDSLSVDFQISNTSNVGTHFSWECPKCFTITPDTGELPPKTSCTLSATFTPQLATVYRDVATCSYGGGGEGTAGKRGVVELRGVGKYPHVVVRLPSSRRRRSRERGGGSGEKEQAEQGGGELVVVATTGSGRGEVVVQFGSVAVGTSAQRCIELINVSPVAASVSLVPKSYSRLSPAHFSCPPSPSTLPPHSSHTLPLTYTPTLPSSHTLFAFFEVKTRGGLGTTTVKCVGTTKVPRVLVEEEVLDFGNLPCGQSVTKTLHIRNDSDVTALFQLQLDVGSVFRADSTCLKLAPHSTHKIPIHFTPLRPAPHCKRVACLVQHQEPLFVYFIGTVYSETVRPVVLQPRHVLDYVANSQTGITKLPPERVVELLAEGSLTVRETTGLVQPTTTTQTTGLVQPTTTTQTTGLVQPTTTTQTTGLVQPTTTTQTTGLVQPTTTTQTTGLVQPTTTTQTPHSAKDVRGQPFTNYLYSLHDPSGIVHVSVDCEDMQFGCVSPHSVSDGKSLHVTNHTEGAVVCVWMTESGGTFSVTPQEKEISPGATCLFTTLFRPKHAGKFFAEELECYVFYKSLSSYESVSAGLQAVLTPPWCLSVRAHGHSFPSTSHIFPPKLVFETRDVVFPASGPLEPVYRSMTVWNEGDTSALFELEPDANQIFTIKPLSGLIPKGQHQTFVMEMRPREAKTYKHITHCLLNATTDYTQELLLSGTAELSPVILENQGRLFFKPTCVGTSSVTGFKITNTAHLPLRYEWRVGGEGSEVIDVEPRQGTILPSESQTHQWQLSPVEAGSLAMRAVLHTSTQEIGGDPSHHHKPRRHKATLELFGQGLHGEIQCSPSSLQFGTVTMGTSHTHTITLHNPTLCTIYYSLHTHTQPLQQSESGGGHNTPSSVAGVSLDPHEGVLHARSSQLVRVTVRPVTTEPYSCTISCQLTSTNPAAATSERRELCKLEITGAYPSLAITDVHGLEVANAMSKAKLWNMLSIDRLNSHLREDPSPSELRYAIATRHSTRRRVSVNTLAEEEYCFGAAPLGSGCSVVHLVLENRGRVETQWGFQFPSDMHLEPEYWADTGSLDEVERHHHDVTTNQLFTVSPKTGRLAPGESVSILCSFKHTHIGHSKLPVLLKIHLGREILLNWSGVTVERGIPHMFFTSHHHSFHPLPIGLTSYPIQIYELHNVGEAAATYEVDSAPLHALTVSNCMVPVLQCLAVQGEVAPGETTSVPFVFSPLEARRYSVDVPISFSTGESVLVTFSGEGVDTISLPSSSPTTDTTHPPAPPTATESPLTHPLPGQTAGLSTELLPLGPLPLFSPVRRLVFLSNYHLTHPLSFSWLLTSAQPAAEVVSVDPREGIVAPGKSCACQVTFYSHSSPALYDLDIICTVADEVEMSEYQKRREEWTRRQENRRHQFTISHPTPASSDEVGPQTIPRKKTLSGSPVHPKSSSTSDLRGSRYQVLPPIGAHPPDMSYEEWKKQDLSIKSKARPRPTHPTTDQAPCPPRPLLLHLGLTAHTHSLTDYTHLCGSLERFHIAPHTQYHTEEEEGAVLRMKTEERDLILSILREMTRELLDDSSFHTDLERLQREPVPYFTQFTSHSPHSSPHSPGAQCEGVESSGDGDDGGSATGDGVREEGRGEIGDGGSDGVREEEGRGESGDEGGEGVREERLVHREIAEHSTSTDLTERYREELGHLTECVLETTLLEVLRESEAGQFDITAPHFLVSQQNTH